MLSPVSTPDSSPSHGHGAFLHRAAHDPQFRSALEANPRAALAEYGLSVDTEQIPSEVTLPSVESLQGVLIQVAQDDSDTNDIELPWMGLVGG